MKNIGNWILDWSAYLTLPIVYYTLRVLRAVLTVKKIKSHKEWSDSENPITNDLMIFIAVLVLSVTWFFWGLWWLLYTFTGLVILLVIAGVYFELRKKWRNRKNKQDGCNIIRNSFYRSAHSLRNWYCVLCYDVPNRQETK